MEFFFLIQKLCVVTSMKGSVANKVTDTRNRIAILPVRGSLSAIDPGRNESHKVSVDELMIGSANWRSIAKDENEKLFFFCTAGAHSSPVPRALSTQNKQRVQPVPLVPRHSIYPR